MVVDVETRAASVTGKMTRACDACTRRSRASWYCPADDAFLCQSCDASVHSANHLAKRHERVRLQPSSLPEDKTTSIWYEGFRRKARTPRNKLSQIEDVNNSSDPLVPELGGEDEDVVFSFSSKDENEESLNCLVPVFDPFSNMVIDDINSFDLAPDGVNITTNRGESGEIEKEVDDGFLEFLPLDMDLAELNMDVESLLEEEQPFLVVKEEDYLGFDINCKAWKGVKGEEEVEEDKCENGGSRETDTGEESEDEDRKMSLFLRLDCEAVITAWGSNGSPWNTGIKPEFSSDDCWPEDQDHQLGGYTCGSREPAVGWMTRQQGRGGGGSDGEREARVTGRNGGRGCSQRR